MTLAPAMTLVEARNAVLTRANYARSGNQAANVRDLVNEFIRSAQRHLYVEADWAALLKRVTIDLEEDEAVYDWPDDTEPGRLQSIVVVDSSNNREYELDFGLRTNERDSAKRQSGLPTLVQYVDKTLEFWPAPNALYTTAIIDYIGTIGPLVEDADELVIDGEAVVSLATMRFKRHLDPGLVTEIEQAEHERYLNRLRAMQSTGEGFHIGGHRSWRAGQQKSNRIGRNGWAGNNAPYSTDWSPY